MAWTKEDDERELRLYVQRKIQAGRVPQGVSSDEYLEIVRKMWDMLPETVRRTINDFNLATEVDRKPHERRGNVYAFKSISRFDS